MFRQGPLPAGTQTTVIAAVGGAGVAAAAEFYLDHRGSRRRSACPDTTKAVGTNHGVASVDGRKPNNSGH